MVKNTKHRFTENQLVRELSWPFAIGTIQSFDRDYECGYPTVHILVKNAFGPGKDSLHTRALDEIVAT
jgi:hypothetical protein